MFNIYTLVSSCLSRGEKHIEQHDWNHQRLGFTALIGWRREDYIPVGTGPNIAHTMENNPKRNIGKKQHRSEIQWARQAEICSTLTSMCSPAHLAKDTVRKQGNMTNRTYNKTWTHTSTLCEDLKHDAWRKPKRHKDSQGIQGHGISGITLYELITGWGVAQRFQDSESLHMQNN